MSLNVACRERAPLRDWKWNREGCDLSKVSKCRQLIFWLLAAMLQCSAEAKQPPVDNHLLCGGKQGEMEQMALVLFCRGCFRWIRNALLNAKLCGRGEANWSSPAPCFSLGKGLLLCVRSNSRVTGEFCSFINVPSSWTDRPSGNFIILLARPFCFSPPSHPTKPPRPTFSFPHWYPFYSKISVCVEAF